MYIRVAFNRQSPENFGDTQRRGKVTSATILPTGTPDESKEPWWCYRGGTIHSFPMMCHCNISNNADDVTEEEGTRKIFLPRDTSQLQPRCTLQKLHVSLHKDKHDMWYWYLASPIRMSNAFNTLYKSLL